MSQTFIGSLDQGTSSTRFMIFDKSGKVVGQHQLEHRQIMPKAGWVEHDASEIWARTQEVIAGALKQAGIIGSQLSAIGITNQRETTVAWDINTGLPLSNAIVWQDTRTADFLESLSNSAKELLINRTGLAIAPYFSASKIHWLLNNVAAVQEALMRLPRPGENLYLRLNAEEVETWKKIVDDPGLPFNCTILVDADVNPGHAYVEVSGARIDVGEQARIALVRAALGLDRDVNEQDSIEQNLSEQEFNDQENQAALGYQDIESSHQDDSVAGDEVKPE